MTVGARPPDHFLRSDGPHLAWVKTRNVSQRPVFRELKAKLSLR